MDYENSDLVRAAYNYYKYPTPVERLKFSNTIISGVKTSVNNFIEEYKDSGEAKQLSYRELKVRKNIESIKKDTLEPREIVVPQKLNLIDSMKKKVSRSNKKRKARFAKMKKNHD